MQCNAARMLGNNDESPPPYSPGEDGSSDGVNFALPFSGVLNGPQEEMALGTQIDQLTRMVNRRDVDLDDDYSVALVSVSNGHDYSHVSDTTSSEQMNAYIRDVTDGIVDAVKRLQDLGVSKVLVNSLPPLGCTPWRSRLSSYARCDSSGNNIANTHNMLLAQKLSGFEDVLLLDLYSTFDSVARSKSGICSS